MKAVIKIATAERKFTDDQDKIIKRVALVLTEHNLSVAVVRKVKKSKQIVPAVRSTTLKLKAG
jgi:hypothetical protein